MVFILVKNFFFNCQNKTPSINMGFLNMYTISTANFLAPITQKHASENEEYKQTQLLKISHFISSVTIRRFKEFMLVKRRYLKRILIRDAMSYIE